MPRRWYKTTLKAFAKTVHQGLLCL